MSTLGHSFALFASAREFAESAVHYAQSRDSHEWKFALLHITTALELLAKARIAFHDPRLVVDGKVDDLQFERGEFRSIGMDQALQRLSQMTGFSLDRRQTAALNAVRRLRNRTVHFADSTSTDEMKAVVAAGLDLFFEVATAERDTEDNLREAREMVKLTQDLSRFREFITCRMASLSDQLRSSECPRTYHFRECGRCLQDAAVIVDDSIVCLFCGDRLGLSDAAALLSDDNSVEMCPKCGRPSVARHERKGFESTYECFCCGDYRGPELHWVDHQGNLCPRLRDFADDRTQGEETTAPSFSTPLP